jgi:formamidopyrimidine-DNA glycosylase
LIKGDTGPTGPQGSSGDKGDFKNNFNVYGREGLPCKICDTPIASIRQGGRSTFLCPKCQA